MEEEEDCCSQVLWASLGIDPADVFAELKRREGTSGVSEKASGPQLGPAS